MATDATFRYGGALIMALTMGFGLGWAIGPIVGLIAGLAAGGAWLAIAVRTRHKQ